MNHHLNLRSILRLALSGTALFCLLGSTPAWAGAVAAPMQSLPPPQPAPADFHDVLGFILQKANQYSGPLEQGITKAVYEMEKETPKVLTEFCTFQFFSHALDAAVELAFLIFLGAAFVTCFWCCRGNWGAEGGMPIAATVTFGALLCIVFPLVIFGAADNSHGLLGHVKTCVEIKTAPRVFLIEQAIHLIKH